MSIRVAEMLGVLSHATDVSFDSVHSHSWRVALISKHVADTAIPECSSDVLMAGLLHDLGNVGAHKHITEFASFEEHTNDLYTRSHSHRGAAIVESIPGMLKAADFIRHHHEHYDGSGYPDRISGAYLTLGTRILGMVDALDLIGGFVNPQAVKSMGANDRQRIDRLWSPHARQALEESARDTDFYRSLLSFGSIRERISSELEKLSVPQELDNESGVERLFHVGAVLVDLKDPSTQGHSFRVARMARDIAVRMKLKPDESHVVYRAGLVHDIGRLGIPTILLSKPGRYNEAEMKLVRRHAELTRTIINCLPSRTELSEIAHIASHDHESFYGKGYPDRLSGDSIPLATRILSAADAYDSMISASNYRLLSPRGVILRLQQGAGTQFDPAVVSALKAVVSESTELSSEHAA